MSSKPWVGKSVVIVDDSASVREDLRQAFEALGVRVVGQAEDGVQGLSLVKQHRPEMVSLDIIMPEMDGVECYRKLKDFDANLHIVMVSWLAGEAKIVDNLKELMPAHIFQTKPVQPQALEARLQLIYFPERLRPAAVPKPPVEEASNDFLGDLGIKVS